MRFAKYTHQLVDKNNNLINRHFIVLKEGSSVVKWTDIHKYTKNSRKRRVVAITSEGERRFDCVVMLLNYAFFDNYSITRLTELNIDIIKDFLRDYGMCRLKGDNDRTRRSKNTVEDCINCVLDFCENLAESEKNISFKKKDLYKEIRTYSKARRRYVTKKVPTFEVNYVAAPESHIFRDMSEGVFQILMNNIYENHKDILILAALSAFAGLRPSEACNVRREDSPLGAGIRFDTIGTEIANIYIDLSREVNIRSDLKSVGGIKKPRTQKVYPAFIEAFYDCYRTYMDYCEGKPYEAEYGALTNNSNGKAMTYASYREKFQKAVKECIPKLLASGEEDLIIYGHILMEHNVSPHILRHWFSVKITLYGATAADLMYWRGDKSPESALTYLQDKSELEKMYEEVNNKSFDYQMWKAAKKQNDQSE